MTDKELEQLAKHNNYSDEHMFMLVQFGRAVLMARRQFDLEEMTRNIREAVRAERNKVAQWMIQRSYATGHGDSVEDLLKELEWQVEEAARKACAKVCKELDAWNMDDPGSSAAKAILKRRQA